MNILFLSELFHPHRGGAELATYLYTNLLAKAEFNLVVVTNRFAGEPSVSKNGNLTFYRLPLLKGRGSIKYSILQRFEVLFSSFLKNLLKWAEVVYIPGSWYLAIPLAKVYGKPVITHLHDYLPICPLTTLYDLSTRTICYHHNRGVCSPKCIVEHERGNGKNSKEALMSAVLNPTVGHFMGRLVALSDSIICVSEAQKRLIMEQMPSIKSKLHVVYNPLPVVPQFNGEGSDFGYFGGSSPLKGFHILGQALQKVNPRIKVHATKMSNVSGNMCDALRRLGIIAYKKLDKKTYKDLYKQVQVVIVPSVWPEPLPYVVSEALLSKRLVIASRVGGIPEQVRDLKGAFLFQPGNHERLAELIHHVRGLSKEAKLDLGCQNRESFLKNFNNEKTFRDFLKVLEKCSS